MSGDVRGVTAWLRGRAGLVVAAAALGGLLLAGCGDGDEVGASDPLVVALVDDIMADEAEGGGVFGGDRSKAECAALELVNGVGKDRLEELDITAENIPDDLEVDWSFAEVEVLTAAFDKCVDLVAYTRAEILAGLADDEKDCVLGELGDDKFRQFLRRTWAAGTDAAAADAAAETFFDELQGAAENCGAVESD